MKYSTKRSLARFRSSTIVNLIWLALFVWAAYEIVKDLIKYWKSDGWLGIIAYVISFAIVFAFVKTTISVLSWCWNKIFSK